jgi:hypothetical protein
VLIAGGQIELVWEADPESDPQDFAGAVPRIKARLPQLADYELTHSLG